VILLLGDFPAWLPVFTFVGGVTTAIIAGLIGVGVAGGLAYEGANLAQGNMPWDDWEGWILGHLKGELGGLGSVVGAARGEDTLQTALKGADTRSGQGGGSGGELQAATGQGPLQIQNAALAAGGAAAPGYQMGAGSQPKPMGGQMMGEGGGGGAARYDAMDAETGPSRGDLLKGAGKDIGIGVAQNVISAIPIIGQIGSVAGTAAQVGGAVAGAAEAAAPAVEAIPGIAAAGAEAVGTAPSFASSALQSLRAIPDTIGTTATGILQKSLLGAGMGAAGAALKGENPLRAAAMGGAGGAVGGIAGVGASQFAPAPVPTIQPNPFPMPEIGAPSFVGGTAPGAPTLGSFAASKIPGLAGGIASAGVGQMMQPPMPSQPGAPVYSSRPSYYDVYDIGGQNATYPGRRPYWG